MSYDEDYYKVMKNIFLVDPYTLGHHLTYMHIYSTTLLSMGHRVVAFTPEPEKLQGLVNGSCLKNPNFQVFPFPDMKNRSWRPTTIRHIIEGLKLWHITDNAIAKAESEIGRSPDLVFFAWLDSYLINGLPITIVDSLFPYPWSGLYFHPWSLRSNTKWSSAINGFFARKRTFSSSNCHAVGLLDEGVFSKIQAIHESVEFVVFPDVSRLIVPDLNNELVKLVLNLAKGRKIVSLLGSLGKRKGVLTFIDAAEKCKNEDLFFVLAGQFHEKDYSNEELQRIENFKKKRPENTFASLEYIECEEVFDALFKISDVIFAVYENFFTSSHMMTKAAIYQKPILVSRDYCMGERVKRYDLGLEVNEGDAKDCLNAINSLLYNNNHQYGFEEYLKKHSVESLVNALKKIISNYS